MKHPTWWAQPLYRLVGLCALPVVLAHLIWRTWHDGGKIYLYQRLGFAAPGMRGAAHRTIWIHAASVGEVNTSAPLLHALRIQFPEHDLLVTTNTPTGKQAFEKLAIAQAHHAYLPLDYAFAVNRFMRCNAIHCGIIIETEIWPLLFERCHFPLAIVNGRLSRRTLRVTEKGLLAAIYYRALSHLDLVLARSETDAAGFIKMGAQAAKVRALGNLKFSGVQAGSANSSQPDKPLHRDYCLLASTHDDEEIQLASLWLQQARPEVLVIAPRHPDRRNTLIRQLSALTSSLRIRSRDEAIDEHTLIYLADTLGEMPGWFCHAKAIFMGGSLVDRGGHNMLEPAQFGQSVVSGPYTSNFAYELVEFLAADAITQVPDAVTAISALAELLDSPSIAQTRGANALGVITRNQALEQRYLLALRPLLDSVSDTAT